MVDAVLFDMDMTLINSRPGMFEAMKRVFTRILGFDPDIPSFFTTPGMTEKTLAQIICKHHKIPYEDAIADEIYDEIARVANEIIRPFPGAGELLGILKEKGYSLALCTNTSKRKMKSNFTASGLSEELFDAIVTAEDIKNGKPDPEIFLKGAALLGKDPALCAVVEDAEIGLQGAKRAGMTSIAVTFSFSEEKLLSMGADFIAPTLLHIPGILDQINRK